MIVPIRNLENKFFFSSAETYTQQTFELPTMAFSTNTRMNILFRSNPDNYEEVRGRNFLPKPQSSRVSSMFLTKSLILYYEKMKLNNNLNKDINMENDSPQLSYVMSKEKANHISIITNSNNNTIDKHILIEHPISSTPHIDDMVINIQLPYNPNAPTKPELWDGSFHPISLY